MYKNTKFTLTPEESGTRIWKAGPLRINNWVSCIQMRKSSELKIIGGWEKDE